MYVAETGAHTITLLPSTPLMTAQGQTYDRYHRVRTPLDRYKGCEWIKAEGVQADRQYSAPMETDIVVTTNLRSACRDVWRDCDAALYRLRIRRECMLTMVDD